MVPCGWEMRFLVVFGVDLSLVFVQYKEEQWLMA